MRSLSCIKSRMSCRIQKIKKELTIQCVIGNLDINCKKRCFGIEGSAMRLYVNNQTGADSTPYWVFYLIELDDSIYPLYYTMSVVDQYDGHYVHTRKGTVVEQAQVKQLLLGELTEGFLKEKKLIKNHAFTVRFMLTLNCEPTGSSKLWDTHSNDFVSFYENKINTDCILKVNNAQFPVHRAILSARSTVFLAMFLHDTAEKHSGEVDIPDVEANILNDVLYYIYSGKIRGLTASTAASIFTIADKYALLELKTECFNFLKSNLTVENIFEAARLSQMYVESDLDEKVLQFFVEKFEEILESSAWQEFLMKETSFANKLLISAFKASSRKRFRLENKEVTNCLYLQPKFEAENDSGRNARQLQVLNFPKKEMHGSMNVLI